MMDSKSHPFPAVNPAPQMPGGGFLHPSLLMALNNMQFTTPHNNVHSMVIPEFGTQTFPSGQIPLNGYHHVSRPEFMEQLQKMVPCETSLKVDLVNAGNTKVWVDTGSFVDSGIDSDNGRHTGSIKEGSKIVSAPSQAKQTVSGERAQQCDKGSPRSHRPQAEQLSSLPSMTSTLPMTSPLPMISPMAMTSTMGNQSLDEMSALKRQMEFLTKQLEYQQYMFSQQQNLWMFENASKMNLSSGAAQPAFQAPPPSLVSHQQMMRHPSQMSMYSNISNNSNGAHSKSNSTATTVVPYNSCLIPPNSLEASNHQTVIERKTLDKETSRQNLGSLHNMNVVGNSTEDEISSIEDEEATGLPKHSTLAIKTQQQQISPLTLKSEHNSQIESISSNNLKSTFSKNLAERNCNSLEHGDANSSPQKDDTIENEDNIEQLIHTTKTSKKEMNEQQKFDETPIFGASEKTFEQLLAEKLKSEGGASAASLLLLEEPVADNAKKAAPVKEIKKQPFLRRGQGLQRFIPGDKRASVAPSTNSNKSGSKNHLKPVSTSRLYEKTKQEDPLKVLGRNSTSDLKIPSPAISTPKQSKVAKLSPYSSENDLRSNIGLEKLERSPLSSNTTSSDNVTRNNLNSYLPNTNSFLVNVQRIEQEKGAANADLELFEMLEKAADTSGCSNVSMLLQYIANNPTASVMMNSLSPVDEVPSSAGAVFPTTESHQTVHPQRMGQTSPRAHNIRSPRPSSEESRKPTNSNSDVSKRVSRSSLNVSNSSNQYLEDNLEPEKEENCDVVKCRKVAKESSLGQVDLGETSSTLTQGKLQPILFEDETPFEDTRLSIETEKHVLANGVQDGNDDDDDAILNALMRDDTSVCVPKKTHEIISRGVYQSGKSSLSLASDDNVSGSLPVPVRASTPPMRKVASKRSTVTYQRTLTVNDDDEDLSDDELNRSRNRVEQSFDDDDHYSSEAVESKNTTSAEKRNQLVAKLFPVLAEPKEQKSALEKPLPGKGHTKNEKGAKAVSDKQQTAANNSKVKNLPSVPVEAAVECGELSGAEMGSKLVEKLKHLDSEISRYRSENNAIAQLRKQREQELVNFREEVANFEREKAEELKRVEKYSLEESAKLKKERKVFEEAQRVAREHLTKREREEVENLKARISELESQLKVKETRWKSATDRLKETVDAQKKEIQELKTANQQLERLRIEQLKKQTRATSGNSSGSSANNSLKKNTKPKTASMSSINQQLSQQLQQVSHNGGLTANKDPTLALKTTKASSNFNHNTPKHNDVTAPKHQKHRSLPSKVCGSNKDLANGTNKLDSPRSRMNGTAHVKTSSEVNPHQGKNVRINDHVVELRHESEEDDEENLVDEHDLKMSENLLKQCNGEVSGVSQSNGILGAEKGEDSASGSRRVGNHHVPTESRNENVDQPASDFNVVEKKLADGSLEYIFSNGTRKEVSADRKNVTIHFFNGDYKQTREDGSVLYYYSSTQTTQTKYTDGLEILEFDCGQLEKHFKDGTKEIYFADKSVKFCHPNGLEETTLSDGTILRVHGSEKTIFYSNGQKEIHTEQYKKREYPDGTCKLQYPDGRQETRFASGRVRIKDASGNVIVDYHQPQTQNSSPLDSDITSRGQTAAGSAIVNAHPSNGGPALKDVVIPRITLE